MAAQVRHKHAIAEPGEIFRIGAQLLACRSKTVANDDGDAFAWTTVVVDDADTVGCR